MILVTGGAGFIGSHIVERLVELGNPVRVIDNLTTGRIENLDHVRRQIEFIEGDICDRETVRRVVQECRAILHLGAVVSVPLSVNDPSYTYKVNVEGTLNLLVAARDAQCHRLVFSSSSAVYGESNQSPQHEAQLPLPASPYASSKLSGETLCSVFYQCYGLETVALRYFNVFGPRQDPLSPYAAVIPKFISSLLSAQPITIFGDGEQTRDLISVDDVVRANLLALDAPSTVGGRAFNIGTGHSLSVNSLLTKLAELTNVSVEPLYAMARPGDIRHSVADTRAANEHLGFVASQPLEDALRKILASNTSDPD